MACWLIEIISKVSQVANHIFKLLSLDFIGNIGRQPQLVIEISKNIMYSNRYHLTQAEEDLLHILEQLEKGETSTKI